MLSSSFTRQLSMQISELDLQTLTEEPSLTQSIPRLGIDLSRMPDTTAAAQREARKQEAETQQEAIHAKIQEAVFDPKLETPVTAKQKKPSSTTSTPASSQRYKYSTRRRRGSGDSPLSTCIQDDDASDSSRSENNEGVALNKVDSCSKKTCLFYDELMLDHVAPLNHPEQGGRILAIITRLQNSV